MYDTILSPFSLGDLTLKNRIIFAPTSMGLPDEEYEKKLKSIAAGGCAMIIIGDVPVGKHSIHSLYSKKGAARYRRITEVIHSEGCLACAQLHQSDSNLKAMIPYLPGILTGRIPMDQVRVILNRQVGKLINGLPEKKVSDIAASFGEAAVLAQKAGFDMIQVHGDRMCGSFSSSVFNQRNDRYGGSPENRARFAVEAVRAVRNALPSIPIDYKLPVRQEAPHYGNAGILPDELPVFVPLLEQAGVTSFHVTLANHSSLTDTIPPRNHPCFSDEGCFLRYCDEVRRYTDLPICGVGGLTDPDFVEKQLSDGRIQLAAMSRQLIADPLWPSKVMSGRPETIRRCVRCNRECLGGMQNHRGVHCIYDKKEEKK